MIARLDPSSSCFTRLDPSSSCFNDTDTVLVEFSDNTVQETQGISEPVYVDIDADGSLVSMSGRRSVLDFAFLTLTVTIKDSDIEVSAKSRTDPLYAKFPAQTDKVKRQMKQRTI